MLILPSFSSASPFREGQCLDFAVTSINPSSVEVNEEFTVGIEITSCGDEIPENITWEIARASPDILIKEPLIINVGKLTYSNSKRFILYHMRTSPDAKPGIHEIKTKLTYGNEYAYVTKEGNFSVTVRSEQSNLGVASIKTDPLRVKTDEEFTLTIKVENFGYGDAKSVKANIDLDFFGVKEAFLGKIEPDEDVPAIFTLKAGNESKIYVYNITLTYRDDFGEHTKIEKLELPILPKEKTNPLIYYIAIGVVVVILIFYLITRLTKQRE